MRIEAGKETILSGLTVALALMSLLVIAGCTAPQKETGTPPVTTTIQSVPAAGIGTVPPTTISTTPPSPQTTFPAGTKPVGQAYEFRDNYGKQTVGIRVKSYAVQNQYNYYYDDAYAPEAVVNAPAGHKFLFVGVTWDLLGVVGGGSRTFFMTPNTTSYRLIYRGNAYEPLYPFNIANPMHYYIKNQGTIVMEKSIDKDNPGSGVLVFSVPSDMAAKDGYIEFCPQNQLIWTILGYPHSPDYWDCTTNTIRWKLV